MSSATENNYLQIVDYTAKELCQKKAGVPWPPINLDQRIEREVKRFVYSDPVRVTLVLENTKSIPFTEDINARILKMNPYGDNLSLEQRNKYTACMAMERDVANATKTIIETKNTVKYWRLYDPDCGKYLTCLDLDPDCSDDKDDVIMDYLSEETAHQARLVYEQIMAQLGMETPVQILGFNVDNEPVNF